MTTKTSARTNKPRKPPAKRAAAKLRARKALAKKVGGKRPADYAVFEAPVEPRHFTVEQIRRAVKSVVNS